MMRSRSSDRSLGTAYTSGLSKSYGGGLNSRPGGRQAERYICKSNYGGTRYRTRSGYDPDYMPRYNTFSGYRNRDRQAYSSAGNYSSYRGKSILLSFLLCLADILLWNIQLLYLY